MSKQGTLELSTVPLTYAARFLADLGPDELPLRSVLEPAPTTGPVEVLLPAVFVTHLLAFEFVRSSWEPRAGATGGDRGETYFLALRDAAAAAVGSASALPRRPPGPCAKASSKPSSKPPTGPPTGTPTGTP